MKLLYSGVAALCLAACATTGYEPITFGMTETEAEANCPPDGRFRAQLGDYNVLECAYKPHEYALANGGRVHQILDPEGYATRASHIICPTMEIERAECENHLRTYVSGRQQLKESYREQQIAARRAERAQRMIAVGAALQALDSPAPTPQPSQSLLGNRPTMMTGFLTRQWSDGTTRTCTYSSESGEIFRTIPVMELCPLTW